MHGAERPAWFVGDLGDPWVRAIADRLPVGCERRQAEAELPESWINDGRTPGSVVLHRPILTPLDASRIARLRAASDSPKTVILCVGPHARHEDLTHTARLFDLVLPEATAAETIARHLGGATPPIRLRTGRAGVQVVAGEFEARRMLVDACRAAGFRAEASIDVPELVPRGTLVWEVPLLDPSWPERLTKRSRTSAVVALLGFADRATVTEARAAGASACLEWPCDIDDLAFVLDRLPVEPGRVVAEAGHVVPPIPALSRRAERAEVAGPGRPA